MTQTIRLNTVPPSAPRNSKRVGRGIGSGLGKTCGRGHKGQRSRSGGRRDAAFEGGQMPLHRRVPKRGFRSRLARQTGHIRLSDLQALTVEAITPEVLREKGLLPHNIRRGRIFCSGEITRAITVSGLPVTRGARVAIEKAGGKVD